MGETNTGMCRQIVQSVKDESLLFLKEAKFLY